MTERTNPHMGIVVGAEDKTAQGFDSVKRRAADMADGVEKSANKAAQAVGSIGDKAQPSAKKVESATRSIIGSLERATAAMNAGEKGTASYYEALGKLRGANMDVLAPYIADLKRAEAASKEMVLRQHEMSSTAALMQRQFVALGGAIAGAFSARAFLAASDAVTQLKNQLLLATYGADEASIAYASLYDIAQRSRTNFVELGKTFSSISRVTGELGISQSQLLKMTEAIGNAVAVSGVTAQASNAALIQLTQGMASGVLRGEELNSVMEQTPRIAMAIADGLNVPIGKLREMGKEGELSSGRVIAALLSQSDVLRDEVLDSTATLGQSMTMLGNSATMMVGEIDRVSGASSFMAAEIRAATSSLDGIGRAFRETSSASNQASSFGDAVATVFETVAVLGVNVAYVFKAVGRELGGLAAQASAVAALDFEQAGRIRDLMIADAQAARREVDELSERIVNSRKASRDAAAADVEQFKAQTQEFSKASQKAARDAKREAEALDALLDKIYGKDAGFNSDYIGNVETLFLGFEKGRISAEGLHDALEKLNAQQPIMKKIADEEKKYADAVSKAYGSIIDEETKRANSLIEGNKQAKEEFATIGMTAEQLVQYTYAKAMATAAADEQAAAEIEVTAALLEQRGDMPEMVAYYRRLAEEKRRAAEAGQVSAVTNAELTRAKEAAREWERTAQTIEQSLTDALMRGFENGAGFAENFRDTLENMFKTLVLRPVIEAIVKPMSLQINGIVNSAVNSIVGGLTGGGSSSLFSTASNLGSLYRNSGSIFGYGRDLYNYATGLTATIGGPALYSGAMSIAPGYSAAGYFGGPAFYSGAMSAAPGYSAGYFGGAAPNIYGGTAAGGSQLGALGTAGAGLAGALWAYNATGSYTAGVAGAAGSIYAAGALTGGSLSAGSAAVANAFGGLGPWGWVAAGVIGVLADIFGGDDPDPRYIYQMHNDLMPDGAVFGQNDTNWNAYGWEDAHKGFEWVTAEGPFGHIGLNIGSKEVDADKMIKQLQALAAYDNLLASAMSAEEVERVRAAMDGWTSSSSRDTLDLRRTPNLAIIERSLEISKAAGGESWDEIWTYAVEAVTKQNAAQMDAALASLTGGGFPLLISGETTRNIGGQSYTYHGGGSYENQGWDAYWQAVDGTVLSRDDMRALVEAEFGAIDAALLAALEDQDISALLGAAQGADQGAGVGTSILERIMGQGAASAGLDFTALSQYILDTFRIDDVQSMLGQLNQTIERGEVRAWMSTAGYTTTGEDGQAVDVDGFSAIAQALGDVWQTIYATPVDVVRLQWEALGKTFTDLGQDVVPTSAEAYRQMLEAIDLNTVAGRDLYITFGALAETVAAMQDAMLGLIGTSRDNLLQIVGQGLSGQSTADQVAEQFEAAVLTGINQAMVGDVAGQITDLMIGQIINPAIEAMILGGELSSAISAAQIDAAVADITARAEALSAIMGSDELQGAMGSLREAFRAIAEAIGWGTTAAEDAANAERERAAAIKSAEDALRSAYQRESSALQSTIDQFGDLAKRLREFREGLLIGDLSPLSLSARYTEADRQFSLTAAVAQLGDTDAMERLTGISSDYLSISAEAAATAEDYYRDFGRVTGVLRNTETVAERQARIAQEQLDALTAQVSALITINESVLTVREAILALNATRSGQPETVTIPGGNNATGVKPGVIDDGSSGGSSGTTPPGGDWPAWLQALPTGGMYNTAYQSPYLVGLTMDQIMLYFDRENWLRSLPAYAVGTPFVPEDQIALLHRGEAIIPAQYNPFSGGGAPDGGLSGTMQDMLAEMRRLNERIADLEAAAIATARHTQGTESTLRRVTNGGSAMQVEAAA